ncbi:hypothetical protein RFI_39014 [Reticulomyxa filosa]|uniref:Uncharacterized protein n=1 Tax=Reticulomyxa filosa TaxID=46433 RepID=X6L8Y1_RETFI|nr:hypothetical protein RFI_39014 [Reticulomyxa filosa]|eukprot:ETN98482.1 hypothetical protein RFI_39014 [Reticulomyxa filosa]
MTATGQEETDGDKFLIKEYQKVNSADSIRPFYELANDLVNTLCDKHKEAAHYSTKRPFSNIYGVTLSGCVQKQLVIPFISCGYLVFLYHLKEKHLDCDDLGTLQNKHAAILKWVKQSIDKIKKELCTDKIKILKHSKSSLKIKWKGLEYHIAIAWTFSKRQYCEFHYIQNNVHVYPFSPRQLQTIANDLIEEAPIHQRHIMNVNEANKKWKKFLEKNVCASLSLLRIHYMREESIGRNTRLAVLFLKAWQHVAMKNRQHLSNNSLEIICVYLCENLKKTQQQLNTPIFASDIIRQFFGLMMRFIKSRDKKEDKTTGATEVNPIVIEWPYPCLMKAEDTGNYKQKLNSVDRHLEMKFTHWKDLFDACEGSLEIINSGKELRFLEFVWDALSLQKKKISKVNVEDILMLAHQEIYKIDRSNELAKYLVEHCANHLKHKISDLTKEQIMEKCEGLYKSYQLDLYFVATHWDTIKMRVQRLIEEKSKSGTFIWSEKEEGRSPLPVIDELIKNIKTKHMRNEERGENEKEKYGSYCSSSSSLSTDEDNNKENESKGIFFFLLIIFDCHDNYNEQIKYCHLLKNTIEETQKSISPSQGKPKNPLRGRTQAQSIVLDPPRSNSQSSEDEITEEKKQDTVVDMAACIIENEFNKRWFTASEFYAVFSKLYLDRVSSDCPKDLNACERILRTARHPNSKFEMFHKKRNIMGASSTHTIITVFQSKCVMLAKDIHLKINFFKATNFFNLQMKKSAGRCRNYIYPKWVFRLYTKNGLRITNRMHNANKKIKLSFFLFCFFIIFVFNSFIELFFLLVLETFLKIKNQNYLKTALLKFFLKQK